MSEVEQYRTMLNELHLVAAGAVPAWFFHPNHDTLTDK